MSLLTEPTQHPVLRSPAPWMLQAESYLLFLRLNELPKGVYDPLEAAWGDAESGEFKGGLGAIMVVRYSGTPVGPYDELMLIPGNFSIPQPQNGPPKIPKKALRIARIYVSQRTTAYNGRLNWNIPKHLARFEFSAPPTLCGTSPPEFLDIKVFPPGSKDGDSVKPFFACKLTPWKWLPAVPVNSKWVPISMAQVQPPVPENAGQKSAAEAEIAGKKIDDHDISEKNEEALAVGTDRWTAFDIDVKVPRARGCWVEVLGTGEKKEAGEGYGTMAEAPGVSDGVDEGRWWPQGLKPWSVGAWLEEGVMDIGVPLEWKL